MGVKNVVFGEIRMWRKKVKRSFPYLFRWMKGNIEINCIKVYPN